MYDIRDFRSDTVTRPTIEMREIFIDAAVGDDVFNDDPSVHQLQDRVASMLGKEAALFVPSGTMSNLIGIMLSCRPGDELLCEGNSHIFHYEQGGYAQIAGVAIRTIATGDGVVTVPHLEQLGVRPDDIHYPRTRLVTLENTHNRGGGKITPLETITEVCDWAHEQGLRTHLDGARIWNAHLATGIELSRLAEPFDTVNVCFSKGLGAPVGSIISGTHEDIQQARRFRKVLGGGMRQAGILAAAATYALDNHLDGMIADHMNASRLAEVAAEIEHLSLPLGMPETNIVLFDIDPTWGTAADLVQKLASVGVLMLAIGPQRVRAVTHLDLTSEDTEVAIEAIRGAMA